ncbi:uncharacterized protein LOC141695750 [Apium graveolens]|uniref:uncharacterized protein LOC141695750 n=1 Tax=Apium graveolens TaxID=4045 RepID=UPI003D7B2A6F
MTLEFGDPDLEGLKFPQDDPLVITPIIGNYPVMRVLVDNGPSMDILFHNTFIMMSYNNSQLTPSDAPIYGFNHVECKVEGVIQLPVTIGEDPGEATHMLNFQVVKAASTYNDIMGITGIHTFKAVPSTYHMVLKFPTRNGVGEAKRDQKMARSFYVVALRPDGTGGQVVKQKKRTYAPNRMEAIKQEVEKLLEAGFIEKVQFTEWLANPVMVKKANGKWRMCIDFTDLNDACPKDCYPHQGLIP